MRDDTPIIVVKKKADHAGHHGGAWKVAYADFVTAMMAFFLVMWILGLNQNVRESIAAYFNDPSGMLKTHAGGSSPMSIARDASGGKPSLLPSMAGLLRDPGDTRRFKAAKQALERRLERIPKLSALSRHVEISITREGLRIELIEVGDSLFFEKGSARLKPDAQQLLRMIAGELRTLPNDITMEGHTDTRPYAGGVLAYSNWELSTDRANSARRAMVRTLRPEQVVEVRGYADRKLRDVKKPTADSNRRVTILVMAGGHVPPPAVGLSRVDAGPGVTPRPVDLRGEYRAAERDARQ
ncbi:MAG: OmpA family protein [Chthonomonadales bacterium]|nr:OmpA family protein [Chthonomonadales bacterium]